MTRSEILRHSHYLAYVTFGPSGAPIRSERKLRVVCGDPAAVALDERKRASIFDDAADRIVESFANLPGVPTWSRTFTRPLNGYVAAYRECKSRGWRNVGRLVVER